jgi:hypothetical protein
MSETLYKHMLVVNLINIFTPTILSFIIEISLRWAATCNARPLMRWHCITYNPSMLIARLIAAVWCAHECYWHMDNNGSLMIKTWLTKLVYGNFCAAPPKCIEYRNVYVLNGQYPHMFSIDFQCMWVTNHNNYLVHWTKAFVIKGIKSSDSTLNI